MEWLNKIDLSSHPSMERARKRAQPYLFLVGNIVAQCNMTGDLLRPVLAAIPQLVRLVRS